MPEFGRYAWAAVFSAWAATSHPAAAQPAPQDTAQEITQAVTQTFNIPAQPLSEALIQFGRQSGLQVSAEAGVIRDMRTAGINGAMTRDQALTTLLAGTGLVYRITGSMVAIERPGSASGAMQLDPVRVQASVPAQAMIDNIPPPYAGGQVATGSQVGLLGNRDVMDTPFNQTSYTAKKVQDQQAQTVREALIDDPSVRAFSVNGSVPGDIVTIRGFEANAYSYGGLYGVLPEWSLMAEIPERIEVLKGLSAMLNGVPPSGNIGGTINLVPKRAPDEPLTQLTAAYNSTAQFGAHADIARRFGPDNEVGVRFNGAFRAGQTAVEGSTDKRALALLGLDFRGEHVRLSADLGYQYVNWGGVVPYVFLAAGVPIPWAPDAAKNFGQPWNTQETKDTFGVVRAELDLTERVTAFASFGVHDFRRSALWAGAAVSVTSFTGAANSTPQRQSDYRTYLTGQAGLRGFVDTGPIEHELAVIGTALEQTVGFASNNGTPFVTNIYSPTVVAQPSLAVPIANKTTAAGQSSVAIADTLSAADKRIQLTVGARWQQVRSTQFNGVTGVATTYYDQSAVSPAAALVFKPWRNVSVYGNWIQGLQEGPIAGPQYTNAGQIFAPFVSTQYEAGVKVDWGKLTTTVDVFQITQPSTTVDVATNALVLAGEQRNQGVEVNFFGEPVEGVRLLGGAMFLAAVLTRTQGGVMNGWWAPNSPGVQLRLAGEWDTPFVRGLTLDGRVVYTSSQYTDTSYPRRTIADWTRFDLGLRYTFDNAASPTGRPVAIRFNVDNLLDASYWMTPTFLGAPRTFRLSLTSNF